MQIRNLLVIACFLLLSGAAHCFEDPTYLVEQERFNISQANDYNIGLFDRQFSEKELVEIIQKGAYEKKYTFQMEAGKYFYFAYLVDNQLGKKERFFLRWASRFKLSRAWHYRDGQIREMTQYTRLHDIFYDDFQPGQSVIIGMRYGGGTMGGSIGSASLLDFHTLHDALDTDMTFNGAIVGSVLIMVFYNIGMFIFFKKRYFLYYVIYSLSATYYMASLGSLIEWSTERIGIATAISGVSLLAFCTSAFSLRKTHPRWHKATLAFQLFFVILGAYTLLSKRIDLINLGTPFGLLFTIALSIRSSLDRFKPAYYMLVGWVVFLISVVAAILNLYVFRWDFNIMGFSIHFGFALELCFFSLAVGLKARMSEQKALRENEHAFEQLKKVFYPHQILQIKSGTPLENTMPTGKSDACVLCFDVVSSSKIKYDDVKSFLETALKRCVAIIAEDYDAETMTSSGYRIKEMGDGFFCSIGFPFKTPDHSSPCSCAVSLAKKILVSFQASVDEFSLRHPVYCSIGITFDQVEGYYPKTGTVEYDVYGRAVILSSRYESARKHLFPRGLHGHIITLQSKVFDRLERTERKGFVLVDLKNYGYVVRDDREAERLYYKVFDPEHCRQLEPQASLEEAS